LFPFQCLGQGVHHPFAVGVNEGAASTQGVSGWILSQEAGFYRLLSGAIRAAKLNGAATWGLVLLSFGYGIFHAAGPGHGKAVIASYMLANERALRRGLVIALGAALLQGFSAVAIVGLSALVFKAAATKMTAAANAVEIVSYAGIAILGAVLVYGKGVALLSAWRGNAPRVAATLAGGGTASAFLADACLDAHVHGPGCGHFHAPDPRTLNAGFSWKSALLTMVAAGARPCSGAILVLVFALAQEIFSAGIFAVVAMSLGTAITTAALASAAVFAKNAAVKYSKSNSRQALMAGRLFEFGAAAAVLGLGLALLLAVLAGGSVAN
jgi:nickel/cobalt transporter (NicO) family protein